MANGEKRPTAEIRLWFALAGVAGFVAVTSMTHFSDGQRHESPEQKQNRIRRIVGEEINRLVPPPEVKAEMRRLQQEIDGLKEKIK